MTTEDKQEKATQYSAWTDDAGTVEFFGLYGRARLHARMHNGNDDVCLHAGSFYREQCRTFRAIYRFESVAHRMDKTDGALQLERDRASRA